MKYLRRLICGAGAAALLTGPMAGRADVTNAPPDFKEVYELIRAHLAGATDTDLNRTATQGLLNQLHSKVSLVSGAMETNGSAEPALLAKSTLYDGATAYLRIGRVGEGLAGQIASSLKKLAGTNQLRGVVLDLRFTGGHDYAAAAEVASLFLAREMPLLDWGNGLVRSKPNPDAITLPVAVLANQQTAAAAEALAAVLRESDQALILGAPTAGEATIGQVFPLKNGQFLRIATAAVKLGDDEMLSAFGVKPDIQVAVNPEDEKVFFADPYKDLPSRAGLIAAFGGTSAGPEGTNRVAARHTTEADLIRERKERPGMELEYNTPDSSQPGPEQPPVIHDPVLGRALDLIKAIASMKPSHGP
jgi:hypothetical protein